MNKHTSAARHFDGHVDKLEQYGVYCQIQHDQGFTGSHWTLPSGNYLVRVASAAARVTINKTTVQHVPTLLAVSMAIAMRRYNTARIAWWRRFVAFIKVTKLHHQVSTHSDIINQTCLPLNLGVCFIVKSLKKARVALITIGIWSINLMRSTKIILWQNTLLGWLNYQIIVILIVFYDMSLTNNHLKY